jgi:polysaccharide biosynthesis protein PslH
MTQPDPFRSRRLLFLLPFAPRRDAPSGGSRAMAQLLVPLSARHQIAIICLRAKQEPGTDDLLRERCDVVEEIWRPEPERSTTQRRRMRLLAGLLRGRPMWATDWDIAAYRARARDFVRAWRPDLVQIEYHIMGQYLSALEDCPAPRVLVEHEPGVAIARERLAAQRGFGRIVAQLDARAWQQFEPALIRQVQAVVVFTEHDRQAIAPYTPSTPIVRISLGTALPQLPLNPLGCPPLSLVFVGSFLHAPNVDAATRLIASIYPRVRAVYPDSILYIVGDQPPPQLKQIAGAGVVVTGRVPDVIPYLDRAALVVAPLRLGAGMRVKILEALAAGKAIIASPLAAQGLQPENGEQIMLAETDEQFVEAIVQLLGAPARRAALAARARAWACANLGEGMAIAAYEALYQQLLECAPRSEPSQ